MRIKLEQFHGLQPRLNPRMLPPSAATIARDCRLYSGKLDAYAKDLKICDMLLTGAEAIYKYGDNWFTYDVPTDVVRGAIADDKSERFYSVKNQEGALPRVSDNTLAVAGNEPTWEADRYYNTGDIVVPSTPNGKRYTAQNAGLSGPSEPAVWNDNEVDNEITWSEEDIPDHSPGATCWNLPDKTYRLGVPAPTQQPVATRVGDAGSILDVEDYEVYAGNAFEFTVTVDGSQDINVEVVVSTRIIVTQPHLSGNHTIEFRLMRGALQLDSEIVNVEADASPQEPNELEEETVGGRPRRTLTATELDLPPGDYTYHVVIVRTAVTPSPLYQDAVKNYYSWIGTTGIGDLGLVLKVGLDHPFAVGDRISILGVQGIPELNSVFDVQGVSDNKVNIIIDGVQASDWVQSTGTWERLPPIEDTYDRAYVYTYIAIMSGKFQEGPPSLPTDVIEVAEQDAEVTISNIETPPTGYNISRIRLYRTIQGDDSTTFKFVGEFTWGASVTDTLDEDDPGVGEEIPSTDWYPPPEDMRNMIEMPGGIIVGSSGKEICFCEPYQPHAWPTAYRQSVRDDPVGMAASGNTVFVLTSGYPYSITGTHPDNMSVDRLEVAQACASKAGIVDMGYAVIYPSQEGLMIISPTRAELLTKPLFDKEQWEKLDPATIVAARYDDRYMFFYEGKDEVEAGGFIFDPKEPGQILVSLNFFPQAVFTDEATGNVYFALDGDIFCFEGDKTDRRSATWQSKMFVTDRPASMQVMQVHASSYPIPVCVTGWDDDGNPHESLTMVPGRKPVRIPAGFRADQWQISVETKVEVEGIYLAETMDELKQI